LEPEIKLLEAKESNIPVWASSEIDMGRESGWCSLLSAYVNMEVILTADGVTTNQSDQGKGAEL